MNTIDPSKQAWRWEENECSVHYESSWTILKWDLEPPWYQCPYIAPLSARSLDIAATREIHQDPRLSAERSGRLLEEVKQEDWFRFAGTLPDMTVRQNRFVTDVTMTGALFKLWESIRLRPTAEAVLVLLRYLETLIHSERLAFEETPYYQQLLLKLAETDEQPEFKLYASASRERSAAEPASGIEFVSATRDYNIVSVGFRVATAAGLSIAKKYYAIAKALGQIDLFRDPLSKTAEALRPVNLFGERLGERELPGLLWVSDTPESAIEKAKTTEREDGEVRLEGDLDGYNIVGTRSGYLALLKSLGPLSLFQERVGERELAPAILRAGTHEEIRAKITSLTQARPEDDHVTNGREGRVV